MKNLKRVLIIFVSLVVLTGGMFAAQKEKSQKKYKISFTERFRLTAWDNAINLDDELADPFAFTRHRSCFTLKYFPSKNIELAVKLTNEFRTYLSPKNREFEINEVIFDNLYLKWKNVGNMPLTLTLGRQNIIFGEGFIMLEGHPLDGSRSIYFNAVRADYQLKKNHLLTAFYTYVPDRDDILPRLNDQERALVPQPETGLGLYYKGKFNKTGVEAYFIRKEVDATDTITVEAGINALGARVVLPLATRLALTGEGAYQFGTYGDYDRGAFGGYFHLDYKLGESVPFLKTLTLGGIYLAGDDPTTDKMEGWD
ncbi:MAG: alginate export family protein, partial [bacterium]|nr:alginate export family protein [bacterium]